MMRAAGAGSALRGIAVLALATVAAGAVAAGEASRVLRVCADPSNLPYSNDRGEGFENRIANLVAKDLNASVEYTWNMQRRGFLRRTLNANACDLVIGLPSGLQGVAHTRPYYASTYVFVTRRERGLALRGFDDPRLRKLKIGLQAVGADGANPPPASALGQRGIVDNIVGFSVWGVESDETPQRHIIDAVASGQIDVAIVWGPFAGFFAQSLGDELVINPVAGDPLQPELEFRYAFSMGVRRGDGALLEEVQQSLDRRQRDIESILIEYGIPLVPLTAEGSLAAVAAGRT